MITNCLCVVINQDFQKNLRINLIKCVNANNLDEICGTFIHL